MFGYFAVTVDCVVVLIELFNSVVGISFFGVVFIFYFVNWV